jgi:hypothetical protein
MAATQAVRRRYIVLALLVIAAALVYVAVAIEAAIQEYRAVVSLQKVGAKVVFDFQSMGKTRPPFVPDGLDSLAVDCLLGDVEGVAFYYTSPTNDLSVMPLSDLPNLQAVVLYGTGVTDLTAARLSRLSKLRSVNLNTTSVTKIGLQQMAACHQLVTLTLYGPTVRDETIHGIREWPALRHLQVIRAAITNAGLADVSTIPTLQSVDLWGAGNITDDGMLGLRSLENLQSLFIINAPITDRGMEACRAWKHLQRLRINSPEITDEGIQNLEGLTELQTVALQESAIRDPAILITLPKLSTLDLSRSQVTEAFVERLSTCRSLTTISLHGTSLSDDSLENLRSLSLLRKLMIGPHITEAAAQHLQAHLPHCEISGVDENGHYSFLLKPR